MKKFIIDFGKSIVLDGLRLGTAAIVSDVLKKRYQRLSNREAKEETEDTNVSTRRISKSFLEETTDDS